MMGDTEIEGSRFNQPIPEKASVFDVNGEKVGSVSGFNAQGEYLTVQKGWLLTHDIYVPSTAIGRVVAAQVHLNLSKDDLKDQRWATPPSGRQESRAADMRFTGASPAPEQGSMEPLSGQMELEQGRVEPVSGQTELEQGRLEDTRATSGKEEDIRLPIREEEFVAGKQAAETKHIRLHKHVVEERATGSVPVTREEVTIERVLAQEGSLTSDDNAFREQDIDIPVKREEVVGGKRVVAREEIRIHKELVTEVEEASGMVRKERWSVEGAEGQDQEILPRDTGEQSAWGSPQAVL
ncbi:MAG TPA: YsnF/AvaK domain-containing protein [Ktedonobacterales bacterium]